MLVLALDTTTGAGSVALANGEQVVEVIAIDPTQPVATRVPGDLITLLERHRIPVGDIGVFAVATGPGSFTGLRIGIATMQGLALANAKPLVGVSSFEALATLANAPRVAVWIDAWRGEVYGALYSAAPKDSATSKDVALRHSAEGSAPKNAVDLLEIGEPIVAPPSNLLAGRAMASAIAHSDLVFIGDGAVKYRDALPSRRVIEPTPLLAGAIAQLARARAEQGETPPPHAIRPLYVRRPDAELARQKSSG
jgi:tRNA threonylcarbamoyladenosine biosynthesis protein TsaB